MVNPLPGPGAVRSTGKLPQHAVPPAVQTAAPGANAGSTPARGATEAKAESELAKVPLNADAKAARAKAEALWVKPSSPTEVAQGVRLDPGKIRPGPSKEVADINSDIEAVKQQFANRKLAEAALDKAGPAARAQYEKLSNALDERPQAQLALQLLLIEGKLTARDTAALSAGGKTLLAELAAFQKAPLHDFVAGRRIDELETMLREMALPAAIDQTGKDSCTAAVLQIMTANERPAEYVRLMTGLMGPDQDGLQASVLLADGKTRLWRQELPEYSDGTERSLPSQLFQNAFMAVASRGWGKDAEYDVKQDKTTFTGQDGRAGLESGQTMAGMDIALEALTGRKYTGYDVATEMAKRLDQALAGAEGRPIEVKLGVKPTINRGQPWSVETVKVTGVETGPDGKTYVFQDPRGATRRMSAKDMGALALQVGDVTPATLGAGALARVQKELREGVAGVPSSIRYGSELDPDTGRIKLHEVFITKVEGGNVVFINPHGKEEAISVADYQERVHFVSYDATTKNRG